MEGMSHFRLRRSISITTAFALATLIFSLVFAFSSRGITFAAGDQLTRVSTDPYTNSTSQHKTEVEPDNFAFGNTIVSTFQVGRFFDGGASNIGWATSTDSGKSWTHGFLPGTTVFASPVGPYARISDPAVAYDAKHKAWLISSIAILDIPGPIGAAVLINRSTDGLTWSNPVSVKLVGHRGFLDKEWVTCDDTATSPFYGHCYVEWDNAGQNNLVQMSTSSDGGKSWGVAKTTADHASVIGGQPVVQPNGTVVVPITVFTANFRFAHLGAFTSTNGGASWSSTVRVASLLIFGEPAPIRNGGGLVSARVDGSGKVYVVWQDCRFEKGCSANDIVMSTSTDGVNWSKVQRIPIDPVGSGIDHLIPGLGVDRSTSGGNAHLGLTYYYFPNANCSTASCDLDVGFISSTNGGASWSHSEQLAGPMQLKWLALTNQGYMVGDYISTAIVSGDNDASPVFAVANPPTGGTSCNVPPIVCHEAMYTTAEDLASIVGGTNTSGSDTVFVVNQQVVHTTRTNF